MYRESNKRLIALIAIIALVFVGLSAEVVKSEETATTDELDFVVDLVDGDESKIASGFWFVEFFAPWCGYCKRLAPVWKDLAAHFHDQKSVMNVARINCDDNPGICGKYEIKGYPTIKLFLDGTKKEYKGLRTKEIFISYLDKMINGYITTVKDKESLTPLLNKISYVFVADSEESLKNNQLFEAFKKSAFELFDTNSPNFIIAIGNDIVDTKVKTPAVILYKEDQTIVFSQQPNQLGKWMKYNQFPLITEVNDQTFTSLIDTYTNLVMFVHHNRPTKEEIELMKDIIKEASKGSELGEFGYSYVSQMQYESWVNKFGLTDMPTLMVIKEKGEIYYHDPELKLTGQGVRKFIEDIKAGRVSVKYLDMGQYYALKVIGFIDEWKWFLAVAIIAAPIIALVVSSKKHDEPEDKKEK